MLRVKDEGRKSFDFAVQEKFLKAWIRPPEYNLDRIRLESFPDVFEEIVDRGDRHITLRIANLEQAIAFTRVVFAAIR